MATYLESVSSWCGTQVGLGMDATAFRWWALKGLNQDGMSLGLTIGANKLLLQIRKLAHNDHPQLASITSADGQSPTVRFSNLEFTVDVNVVRPFVEPVEALSLAWRTLDMRVLEDQGRLGRLRFDLLRSTGAAATRLGKVADFNALIQAGGLTAAEYEQAVTQLIANAITEDFARVLVKQLPLPDYRPYLAGIRIGRGVSLTTFGSKAWLKGAASIDAIDFVRRTETEPIRAPEREALPSRTAAIPSMQDAEAMEKPIVIYLPASTYLDAIASQLPATVQRYRTRWPAWLPCQGMLELTARRVSLQFETNYGLPTEDQESWRLKVRWTASGTAQSSEMSVCTEISPPHSQVDIDTREVTLSLSTKFFVLTGPVMRYHITQPSLSITYSPLTDAIRHSLMDNEVRSVMQELVEATVHAANIPWLNRDIVPHLGPTDEWVVLPAPGGLLFSRLAG